MRWPLVGSSAAAAPAAAVPTPDAASLLETSAFFAHFGQESGERLREKREWRSALDNGIEHVLPFLRSEGYSVAFEGVADLNGDPVVYSNGLPHGSPADVERQVSYTNERVLAQCAERGQPAVRATTIVNVRSPSFRFPDAGLIAGIRLGRTRYPWASDGLTLFVGAPAPVRWAFDRLRSICSATQLDSLRFVTQEELGEHVPRASLPAELGGTGRWDVEQYIASRCRAEGVRYAGTLGEVRPYKGMRLDWDVLDRRRAGAGRRRRARADGDEA